MTDEVVSWGPALPDGWHIHSIDLRPDYHGIDGEIDVTFRSDTGIEVYMSFSRRPDLSLVYQWLSLTGAIDEGADTIEISRRSQIEEYGAGHRLRLGG